MSKWGAALGQGIAAVAKVGTDGIDTQLKLDAAVMAEQRAADIKLNTAERMMAIEEAMRNRAGDRFTAIYKTKMGEEIPVDAPTLEQTGVTRESAVEATADKPGADFAQSPTDLAALEQQLKRAAGNPDATDEQRQDARDALAALQAQKAKQKDVNAASVEGKTRKRTDTEAARAAMEEAAGSDFGAFTAANGAWKDAFAREDKAKDHAIAAADKDADRESREKVAGIQADTRREIAGEQVEARREIAAAETARKTEADQLRYKAAQERVTALAGGKGAKATALMQNYQFLVEKLGKSSQEAEKVLFSAKDSSEAEKVFKLMLADKFGDLTVEDAVAKVRGVTDAVKAPAPAPAAAGAAPKRRKYNAATQELE